MATVSKSASSSSDEEVDLRRGPWTYEEDTLLINYITHHGEGHWNLLAKRSGLRRTGKSCRLRWLNYLKPDVKRGNLSPQEQLLILNLHSKWGNRWSKIAQFLPGRTDNEIKNYWRTRVQKQARHLKIDPNSAAFKEIIECFWIPRLVQKMQGSLPSSAIPTQHLISDHDGPLTHARGVSLQVPTHVSLNIGGTAESLAKHTSSAHYTNASVPSSEPLNLPQVPQISESSASPGHAMATNCDYSTFLKSYSGLENISYDVETFSLASSFTVEDCRYPCNWIGSDFTESLWNMDEQW